MSTITPEQIHQVADRLQAEGTRPTLAAVRQALGGGSFTTISEAMKSWRAQVQEEHELALVQVPAALDERMEQLKRAAWEVAQQEAENRLKSEREALANQRQEMDSQLNELHQLMEILETEASEKDAALASLRASSAEELALLKQQKEEQSRSFSDQLGQLKGELAEKNSELKKLGEQLGLTQRELSASGTELIGMRAKAESYHRENQTLTQNMEYYRDLQTRSEAKVDRLQNELDQLHEAMSEQKSKNEALAAQAVMHVAELEKLQALEKTLRAKNEELAQKLARAEVFEQLLEEEKKKEADSAAQK
ncbi:DNA-binding protein [Marinospirillum sp. MEB164]|uniref:DNA-binding protein n=1 Tax=Marinospirillum alkalitolerans TaxID=3123374 RepID=A0ABW8Q160_9GAMM